jgi:hypothetical protein
MRQQMYRCLCRKIIDFFVLYIAMQKFYAIVSLHDVFRGFEPQRVKQGVAKENKFLTHHPILIITCILFSILLNLCGGYAFKTKTAVMHIVHGVNECRTQ